MTQHFNSDSVIWHTYMLQQASLQKGIKKEVSKKSGCAFRHTHFLFILAEREGFEPPVPLSTTVFKTAAIDHSAISPKLPFRSAFLQKRCKVTAFFLFCKVLLEKK